MCVCVCVCVCERPRIIFVLCRFYYVCCFCVCVCGGFGDIFVCLFVSFYNVFQSTECRLSRSAGFCLIVEKGWEETCCHHMGYSFRVLLYAPSYRQDSTYTAFVTPVVEHWLEREIAQWVHHEGSIRTTHRTMSERSYHGATSRSSILGCEVCIYQL